jgi:hypothetical protein
MFGTNREEHRRTNDILERIASSLEEQLALHKQAQNVDVGEKVGEIFDAISKTNPLIESITKSALPGGS